MDRPRSSARHSPRARGTATPAARGLLPASRVRPAPPAESAARPGHTDPGPLEDERALVALERCAVRLANAAGARILAAAGGGRAFAVHFKAPSAGHSPNSN